MTIGSGSEVHTLVNIILVFGRNNDRNVQVIVNGRFGDRLRTYFCITINFLNHVRSFFGPNAVLVQSESRLKIVIFHLQSLCKVPKKVLLWYFWAEYV